MVGFSRTDLESGVTEGRGLKRSMKVLGTLLITLLLCSPTAGVFVIMPGILLACGSGAFLTMLLGGVIGVFMAFVYAELSSAYPVAGGEYAMVARAAGSAAGFLVLGVSLVSNVLSPAVVALGISGYLGALHPNLPVIPTAIATIALTTLMCVLNIRTNAAITGVSVNNCLVLGGMRETGTSEGFEILGGPYYTDEIAVAGTKGAELQMKGVWIIELPLDSMSPLKLNNVEAFVTRRADRVWSPSAAHLVKSPRQCVVGATANGFDPYGSDMIVRSGFFNVKCKSIDLDNWSHT